MFTVDKVVAMAPNMVAVALVECAKRCIPPKAVVPEIALVTAIKGECKACVTPMTTWTPITLLRQKVENMLIKAAFGATAPMPIIAAAAYVAFLAPCTYGAR